MNDLHNHIKSKIIESFVKITVEKDSIVELYLIKDNKIVSVPAKALTITLFGGNPQKGKTFNIHWPIVDDIISSKATDDEAFKNRVEQLSLKQGDISNIIFRATCGILDITGWEDHSFETSPFI